MATLLWVVTGNEQNDIHTLSHDIYIYTTETYHSNTPKMMNGTGFGKEQCTHTD